VKLVLKGHHTTKVGAKTYDFNWLVEAFRLMDFFGIFFISFVFGFVIIVLFDLVFFSSKIHLSTFFLHDDLNLLPNLFSSSDLIEGAIPQRGELSRSRCCCVSGKTPLVLEIEESPVVLVDAIIEPINNPLLSDTKYKTALSNTKLLKGTLLIKVVLLTTLLIKTQLRWVTKQGAIVLKIIQLWFR